MRVLKYILNDHESTMLPSGAIPLHVGVQTIDGMPHVVAWAEVPEEYSFKSKTEVFSILTGGSLDRPGAYIGTVQRPQTDGSELVQHFYWSTGG